MIARNYKAPDFLRQPDIQKLIKVNYQPFWRSSGKYHSGIKTYKDYVLKTLPTKDTPTRFINPKSQAFTIKRIFMLYERIYHPEVFKTLTQCSVSISKNSVETAAEIRRHCDNPTAVEHLGYFRVKPKDPLSQYLRPGVHLIMKKAPGRSLNFWRNPFIRLFLGPKAAYLKYWMATLGEADQIGRKTRIALSDRNYGNIYWDPATNLVTHIDIYRPRY